MKNFILGLFILIFTLISYLKSDKYFETAISIGILGVSLMVIGLIEIFHSNKTEK